MTLQQRDMLMETCWPAASLQVTEEPRRKAPRPNPGTIENPLHIDACQLPWNGLYLSEAYRFIPETSAQENIRDLDDQMYAVPLNHSQPEFRSILQLVADVGVSNSTIKALGVVHAEMRGLASLSGLFSLAFQRGMFYRHGRDIDWLIWVAGNKTYRFPMKSEIGATVVGPALYWSSFTLMTARWLTYVSTKNLYSYIKQSTLYPHLILLVKSSSISNIANLQTSESTELFAFASLPY